MTRKSFAMAAMAGSSLLLLGALGFQYIGEMPPCKLCYWQRYPHVIAIFAGVLFWLSGRGTFLWLGALSAAATATIGVYHTGVEKKWWQGPTSCTSGSVEGLSTEELLNQIMTAPLVRCDEVPWALFGLSMASWNAIASLVLVALWLKAIRSA